MHLPTAGKIFKSSGVIVTTNSSFVTPKFSSYFNVRYVMMGVNPGQQTALINHYAQVTETDSDRYYSLKSIVTDTTDIIGASLSRKPLLCLMLCLLSEYRYKLNFISESEVLLEWLQCLQDIHPEKPEEDASEISIEDGEDVQHEKSEKRDDPDDEKNIVNKVEDAVAFLCDQALTMLLQGTNQLVLDKELDCNVILVLPDLGLTKPCPFLDENKNKELHTFSHRAYHEMLAAKRMSQLTTGDADDIITRIVNDPLFHNVLKYYCGIVKNQTECPSLEHLFTEFSELNSEIWKELPYVENNADINPLEMFLQREGPMSKFQLCLECLNECDGKHSMRGLIVDTFPTKLLLRQQSNTTPEVVGGLAYLLRKSAVSITQLEIKLDQFAIYNLHAFQRFADALNNNPSIQSIKLLWYTENILAEFLVRVFAGNLSITEVVCVADSPKIANQISPVVWADLRIACRNMGHVVAFELAKCTEATIVAHIVRHLPYTIQSLWLYRCHCDIIALQELSTRMVKSTALLELSLQESMFFHADFKHIVIGLRQCLGLETLNVSYIKFNQNNFIEIAQALKFNDTLLVLNLSGSKLREQACSELASALRLNNIICEVILYDTEISQESMEKIQRNKNGKLMLPGATLLNLAPIDGDTLGPMKRSDSVTSAYRRDSRRHSLHKPSSRRSSIGYQTRTYFYYSKT